MATPIEIPTTGEDTTPAGASKAKTTLRIAVRVLFAVAALGIAVFVLTGIFDDLDLAQIGAALNELSDAEWISLAMGWAIWVGFQGLQTASLVTGMPARRGVLAYLGPSAVASIIPGPSDLPVRYSMYQSWGTSSKEATTAVAASGIFSVGSQLALPAFAGVAIAFSGIEVDGFLTVIVVTTVTLAVVICTLALTLGAEQRTRWVATRLDPVFRAARRLLRKPPPAEDLGSMVVGYRSTAIEHLAGKWLPTSGATALTIVAKCSLLIMSLRFVGIPEDALGWSAIFAVFSLVAGLTIIPITPGSAGVSELALVGMLTPIAGTQYVNEVAAGVLLYRLLTWILLIPAGLAVLGTWRLQQRRAHVSLDAAS